jgi:hypothetical protein
MNYPPATNRTQLDLLDAMPTILIMTARRTGMRPLLLETNAASSL